MADIELVIKIPEELLEYFANHNCMSEDGWFSHSSKLLDAFRNGIPLPKGHGRLIDADKANKKMQYYHDDCAKTSVYTRLGFETAMNVVNDAPTIIEADTESEG